MRKPNFDLMPMLRRLRQAYWDMSQNPDHPLHSLGIRASNIGADADIVIDDQNVSQYVPGLVIQVPDDGASFASSAISKVYEGTITVQLIFSHFVGLTEDRGPSMIEALGLLANAFIPDPEDEDADIYAFPNWTVELCQEHNQAPTDLLSVEFLVNPDVDSYAGSEVEHGAVVLTILLET